MGFFTGTVDLSHLTMPASAYWAQHYNKKDAYVAPDGGPLSFIPCERGAMLEGQLPTYAPIPLFVRLSAFFLHV